MAPSAGSRVGLVMAAPAHGAEANLAAGLLQVGLLACVYFVRRVARGRARHKPAQLHLRQALTAPLRYFGVLARVLAAERWSTFDAAVRIAAEARRDAVTHLHACDEESGAAARWAARLAATGFSLTLPQRVPLLARGRQLQGRLRAARFVLATSNAGARAASALAPGVDVRRAYPGVDYRRFSPRLRRDVARVPLVLAVAQTRSSERIGGVIEACRRLVQGGLEMRCDLVCSTADVAAAQGGVERAGLQHVVRVLGPLGPCALVDRLARAALFLQVPQPDATGLSTSIPLETLQAMALGLPVLAEESPLVAECITHGESGWLFAAPDSDALAHAVQHVLTTPRLGEHLGRHARERVFERFDVEVNLLAVRAWLEAASREAAARHGRAWLVRQAHRLHHA